MKLKNYTQIIKENNDDQLGHLLHLLRLVFKNSGLDAQITNNDDLDISIAVFMNEKERLNNVVKVFEVIKKIKRDTLGQYDSEFEIQYSKKMRKTMLIFNFYYGDGLDDDNSPF
jgi:hypothetical protein